MATTLYHPNVPGLVRVRADQKEIDAHVEAGWLDEDPKVTAEKAAAAEAETAKRSEAAKKAAETRRKNSESPTPDGDGDAPVVTIATDTQ